MRGALPLISFFLAEESGSRTHKGPPAAPTGFEVRPPHRGRFPSVPLENPSIADQPRSTTFIRRRARYIAATFYTAS